jgi:hypothetical protein
MLLASSSASFSLSLTVPVIQDIQRLPNGQVHVIDNTGQPVTSTFTLNGVKYSLTDCNLTPHPIIDAICNLTPVSP